MHDSCGDTRQERERERERENDRERKRGDVYSNNLISLCGYNNKHLYRFCFSKGNGNGNRERRKNRATQRTGCSEGKEIYMGIKGGSCQSMNVPVYDCDIETVSPPSIRHANEQISKNIEYLSSHQHKQNRIHTQSTFSLFSLFLFSNTNIVGVCVLFLCV